MIFLSVGSELRFDRLVKAVDNWSASNKHIEIFGQIADPGTTGYRPSSFKWQDFLTPIEYQSYVENADLIIGHAGMGCIITALMAAKPILIMPRRSVFKETRNDHQVATVKRFSAHQSILVADDETCISPLLNNFKNSKHSIIPSKIGNYAGERLVTAIREFIVSGKL